DGRCRAELSLPAGTSHVLAVTVAGDRAVAGESVQVVAAPPVTDLRAERFDTVVRLSWAWPEHATTAVVSWWNARSGVGGVGDSNGPSDPNGSGDPCGASGPGGTSGPVVSTERESRLRYETEGGFEAHTGSGP